MFGLQWCVAFWCTAKCFSYTYICACVCAQLLSHVQLFETSRTVTCQSPLSKGFSQARILEWVAISSSRESSQSMDWAHIFSVSCIGRQILYYCATWEAHTYIINHNGKKCENEYIYIHTHIYVYVCIYIYTYMHVIFNIIFHCDLLQDIFPSVI